MTEIREYWRILRARWYIPVILTVLTVALTLITAQTPPPTFVASTRFTISVSADRPLQGVDPALTGAQASEYILLGSNTRGDPAATKGDIRVYNPQYFGTPGDETIPTTSDFTCSGGSTEAGPHYFGGTKGIIATRAKELAGPNSADNFSKHFWWL